MSSKKSKSKSAATAAKGQGGGEEDDAEEEDKQDGKEESSSAQGAQQTKDAVTKASGGPPPQQSGVPASETTSGTAGGGSGKRIGPTFKTLPQIGAPLKALAPLVKKPAGRVPPPPTKDMPDRMKPSPAATGPTILQGKDQASVLSKGNPSLMNKKAAEAAAKPASQTQVASGPDQAPGPPVAPAHPLHKKPAMIRTGEHAFAHSPQTGPVASPKKQPVKTGKPISIEFSGDVGRVSMHSHTSKGLWNKMGMKQESSTASRGAKSPTKTVARHMATRSGEKSGAKSEAKSGLISGARSLEPPQSETTATTVIKAASPVEKSEEGDPLSIDISRPPRSGEAYSSKASQQLGRRGPYLEADEQTQSAKKFKMDAQPIRKKKISTSPYLEKVKIVIPNPNAKKTFKRTPKKKAGKQKRKRPVKKKKKPVAKRRTKQAHGGKAQRKVGPTKRSPAKKKRVNTQATASKYHVRSHTRHYPGGHKATPPRKAKAVKASTKRKLKKNAAKKKKKPQRRKRRDTSSSYCRHGELIIDTEPSIIYTCPLCSSLHSSNVSTKKKKKNRRRK